MEPIKRTKAKQKKPVYISINGSVRVPVYEIHQNKPRKRIVYSVMWYDAKGLRKELKRVSLEDAKREADSKAKELNSAKRAADRLKVHQKDSYVLAQDIVGSVPLVTVAREWKKAMELTDGNLIAAAQAWRDTHSSTIEILKVSEAIKRFTVSKARAGYNVKASYARTLPQFEEQFGNQTINTITSRRLQDWLDKTFDHPVTRNTHRKRIVTLWRFCRDQGYLPRNAQTEAELTHRAREDAPEIGIIDAKTYSRLLDYIQTHHPHYLAALILAGFCGMRRNEVQLQLWDDIHLGRKLLRVTAGKPGTPAKRLVTLCDTAIEWLMLCENRVGEVCPGSTLILDRIRKIGKNAGLDLPANCFRHSFISCRVAATGEIDRTALEAGTSVRMIHKHYRELVTKEEGEEWFSIRPSDEVGKVVNFENS